MNLKSWIKKILKHESLIFQTYFYLKYILAKFKYGSFKNDFVFIAYTGTNGKSSCTNLMYQALRDLGENVAMISTVNMAINENVFSNKSKMTSLGIFDFFKFLKDAKSANVKYVILEYSSHAFIQKRLFGINFRQINLTSLMADHLEYHGSKLEYWNVKFDIVRSILKNSDAKFFCNENYVRLLPEDLVPSVYGKLTFENQGLLKNVEFNVNSTHFELDNFKINSALISVLNLNNLLGIYIQLLDLGFEKARVLEVISKLQPVKGRFEYIADANLEIVLDYAHSEDSMENILKFFKKELNKDIIVVFGATGGGRDVLKRPKMGRVADLYASRIVLTSDDPYEDDPMQIIKDISEGVFHKDKIIFEVNRELAIKKAFEISTSNNLIVILGKAGEEVMAVNGKLIKYSDLEVVKNLLTQINES